MRFSWRFAVGCASLGAAIFAGLSCELVVSTDALQNGQCGAGLKACPNPQGGAKECVDLDDPGFQCASTACSPCALPHAIDICNASGSCAIGSCTQSTNAVGVVIEEWMDCNNVTSDGCEADILHGSPGLGSAIENCGQCGTTCAGLNVRVNACTAGSCAIDECMPGYLDCDKSVSNGCERQTDAGSCDAG